MFVAPSPWYFIYAFGWEGIFFIVMKELCKPWKHTVNMHYLYVNIELGAMM
jgi:hypothetical protein